MTAIARPCRRAFLGVLATATTWPLTGRAQLRSLPVIGFLHSGSPEANVKRLEGFRRGLTEAGFAEGTDVTIEYRWAEGKADRLPELAADLVRREVAVIATPGSAPAALAAKQATASVPVVFATGGDPIGLGLVTSLSRPAGNVTGVASLNADLAAKRLAICRELVPQAAHYFALVNPTSPLTESYTKELLAGAATLGIAIRVLRASTDEEIEAAFAILPRQAGTVVVFGPDAFFYIRRDKIAGACCASGRADDLRHARLCGGRRTCELRRGFRRFDAAGRKLHGAYPEGREAGQPAGHTVDQIRAGDQSSNREGARYRDPEHGPRARRRGDRLAPLRFN
jgi:putative tryptophan/tyrosine transport system substrate-binding protein